MNRQSSEVVWPWFAEKEPGHQVAARSRAASDEREGSEGRRAQAKPAGLLSRAGAEWPLLLTLCLFVAFMIVLVPHHEPWADEAQAWQLAKYETFSQLFLRLLHFEITPGLWHVLLRLEAIARTSYGAMHWITAGLETAAIAVMLWRSPFPLWMRVALPFTFFLVFQYAVVARSYSLCPLLLFLLASQWRHRGERPLTVAVLLALLASSCAQETVVVIGLCVVLSIEAWRGRASRRGRWGVLLLAASIVIAAIAFALWCCKSPSDAPWVLATNAWMRGGTVAPPGVELPRHELWLRLFRAALHGRKEAFKLALCGGLAFPYWVGFSVWIALAFHLLQARRLRYFWPVGLLVFFGTFTRFSPYHQGLVWLLVLFLLWVTWPERRTITHHALLVTVAACGLVQLRWTADAVRREVRGPYAPTCEGVAEMERYLRQGARVDLAMLKGPLAYTPPAFFAVGVQPYFATQPFANMTTRYWAWQGDPRAYEQYIRDTEERSAVVLEVADLDRERENVRRLLRLGYREQHRYCARNIYPWHDPVDVICYRFFEPPAFASPSAGSVDAAKP